jgi:hypothetical protein
MGTPGFPPTSNIPGSGAGITSEIEMQRGIPVRVHNSRIAIATIFLISISAAFISICMVLYVFSIFSSGFSLSNLFSALVWALSAFSIGYMCPWLWKMASSMSAHRVTLDVHGVNFKLGTKKKPVDVFLGWDEISGLWHERINNAHYYFVQSKGGGEVRLSSYTFFRPKKVVRLIAARTGLAIQEA